MTCARTGILLFAATILSGILAGGVIDRAIVGRPASHELGAQAWLQFSRHAALGTGLGGTVSLSMIGDPDAVAAKFKFLSDAGLDGMAFALVFPYQR